MMVLVMRPGHWLLQRGRARAGAEIPALKLQCEKVVSGFNGAAPARARKCCCGENTFNRIERGFNGTAPARARKSRIRLCMHRCRRASTGPRPRGRGNMPLHNVPRPELRASTGPRPRGRGNDEAARQSFNKAPLQRGRARAGAEIAFRAGEQAVHFMLQRGRARAGAEILVAAVAIKAQRLGFNGAAPARARKYRLRERMTPDPRPGFNGAAPARARKYQLSE